mmetsp:Transcript_15163/g.33816  ORF Transcript_15163/g.33816 Transcript_15163/m.33816 type:complete len:100 (+) Transcript_15163:138-437(+)
MRCTAFAVLLAAVAAESAAEKAAVAKGDGEVADDDDEEYTYADDDNTDDADSVAILAQALPRLLQAQASSFLHTRSPTLACSLRHALHSFCGSASCCGR